MFKGEATMPGKRDENYIVVGMGVSSDDNITPVPITVDPSTGRLRVYISSTDGGTATPTANRPARRDENNVITAMGETNDSDRTPTPLSLHNGALMVQAN